MTTTKPNPFLEESVHAARQYEQVAGPIAPVVRGGKKLMKKGIDWLDDAQSVRTFENHRNRVPTRETGLTPEQLRQIQDEYLTGMQGEARPDAVTDKRTPERNINIQRHHQGALANMDDPTVSLQNMQTADDIALLLDVTASKFEQQGPRTHAEIASRVQDDKDVLSALKPVFAGEQNGLLNDRQLYAARTMLATMGEEMAGLAKEINGGNHTPDLLLKYRQKMELWTAMQGYVQGQVKEVARALSQQNMIAKSLDGQSAQDLLSAMHAAGTSKETIIKQAAILEKHLEKANGDVIAGTASAMRPIHQTALGAAVEYWKNNILSGPSTHAVNMLSNTATNMYETLLIRPTAAAVGGVRRKITGATDGVTGQEALINVTSTMVGLESGLKAMIRALISGEGQFGADKAEFESNIYELARRSGMSDTMSQGIQTATSLSFRALTAEDELFKTTAFIQELHALGMRDGVAKGLTGDELAAHVNGVVDNPPDEIYDAAMQHAKTLTFTNEDLGGVLGLMARGTKTLIANYPVFGFLAPFVNTPANLVNYSLNNSPIFSIVNREAWEAYQKGGAERDLVTARVITAHAMGFAIWQAYESGNITGSGPQDYNLADLRDMEGERPESIIFGEGADAKYLEVGRLDPMAQSLLGIVNAMEAMKYAKDEKDAADAFNYIVAEMAKHTFDSTYMKGFGDLVEVLAGRKDPSSIPAGIATGLIPYVGALKAARKMNSTDRRRFIKGLEDQGVLSSFSARVGHSAKESLPDPILDIMGLERSGAYARYWDGTEMRPRMGEAIWSMSPVKLSGVPGHEDPVNKQLIRNRVAPSPPSPLITIPGSQPVEISLADIDGTGKLYDEYQVRVGKMRREVLTKFVQSSRYKDLDAGPRSLQAQFLRTALADALASAKADFMRDLPGMLKDIDTPQANALKDGLKDYGRRAAQGQLPEELEDSYRVKKEGGDPDPLPAHTRPPSF